MTTTVLPEHGLLIQPSVTPDEALTTAAEWCAARGLDEWGIADLNVPARIRRAWWGGPGLGFVGVDHPDAVEVVVVGLPEHLLTEEA